MTDFTVWLASESHSDGQRFSANYPQTAAEMFADWKDSCGENYAVALRNLHRLFRNARSTRRSD